ncbi:serine/threonine-protein kinase [Chlorogloeopsis sp. ULAP01]|uniref:serine/threonine-protein kinase n=1 Tax=Chlorogloeopsis sp. ULAP01 TaxID=3056483 RepID=UPI0025AA5C95|nr:serine/threonine-protein kinase [Chlorogloeopsis sp. ULAP01]MDM9381848.1 serine/threonine-protein kinase [Chlorogloeopsis sp. ULAP01]
MPMLLNNRYQVIQTLGSGGFGETFLAEDTQMPSRRRCVIKQLKPIQDNPQVYQLVQQRFGREAAILEEVGDGSEQIPKLYAYFLENGQFYLVQEYIQGQTLTQKIQQQGLMSESGVKEILISILPVLDYVHSKGIVHRDIKPDNIILRNPPASSTPPYQGGVRGGEPVLIDFGAVKETIGTLVTPSGNSTRSIVIGTPGFMPSEQSVGRPMFASDIYSLGLTAIYLLTGKMPQEMGTDPATGALLWRQYALGVTPSFAAVLDKAIQFNARDRFASAREMLQSLQSGAAPFPPTVPYTQPLVATTPSSQIPQNTVAVSPSNSYKTPVNQSNRGGQRGILLGSIIAGILIGTSVIIGFVLNNRQQLPQIAQQEIPQSTSEPSPTPVEPKSESSQQPLEPNHTVSSEPTPETSIPQAVRTSPEEFIRNYYATINQGEYQQAWKYLAPSFQSNKRLHPQGYLSYIDWWGGRVQQIEVDKVNLIKTGTQTATVNAQLKYLMKNGRVVPSSVNFSLLWDVENSGWVIADAK